MNFNWQRKYKINKGLQSGTAPFKYFLVATSKDLLHYIDRTLEDHFFEVAIIYIGVNDINSNRNSADFDHVFKNIKNIVQECRSYGIENIFISGLLQTTRITAHVIGKVNELIKDTCKVERCFYVSNDNITHANLFKDGLNLLDNGKKILADNFVFNVNKNFLTLRTFHPIVHLTAALILLSKMMVLKTSHLILKNLKKLD